MPLQDVDCNIEVTDKELSLNSDIYIIAALKSNGPEKHIWAEIGWGNGGFIMRVRSDGRNDNYFPNQNETVHLDPGSFSSIGKYNTLPYGGTIGFETDFAARTLFANPGKYTITMMYVTIANRAWAPREIQSNLIAKDQPPIVCPSVEITVT